MKTCLGDAVLLRGTSRLAAHAKTVGRIRVVEAIGAGMALWTGPGTTARTVGDAEIGARGTSAAPVHSFGRARLVCGCDRFAGGFRGRPLPSPGYLDGRRRAEWALAGSRLAGLSARRESDILFDIIYLIGRYRGRPDWVAARDLAAGPACDERPGALRAAVLGAEARSAVRCCSGPLSLPLSLFREARCWRARAGSGDEARCARLRGRPSRNQSAFGCSIGRPRGPASRGKAAES